MWFKNLKIYRYSEQVVFAPEKLADHLSEHRFKTCDKNLPMSLGWVSPVGQGDDASLVHGAHGFMMLCLKKQEKIIPPAVVREQVNEKIAEMEQYHDRKLSKKEKETIKDEVYFSMLPQAFSKSTKLYAYIDTQLNLLIIDTPSAQKAEEFTVFLRKTLGSLKISTPETATPAVLLTDWVKNNSQPSAFVVEDACVLRDNGDARGIIRAQGQDLSSDNIQAFLQSGCFVTQLTLSWAGQLVFTFKDDLTIASMKYLEVVQELADDIVTETVEQRFDAEFVIMTQTLQQFLQHLLEAMVSKDQKKPEAVAELTA